jgi:hypothetical protein
MRQGKEIFAVGPFEATCRTRTIALSPIPSDDLDAIVSATLTEGRQSSARITHAVPDES